MQKTLITIVIAVIAGGGGGFYVGMKYAQTKTSGDFRPGRNLSPEERRQRFYERGRQSGRSGADSTNGEIISKDGNGFTIKLRDGGSKIIFISESTEIGKFATGTVNDLKVGKTITVNGKPNSDGSLTADSIQVRPLIQPSSQ